MAFSLSFYCAFSHTLCVELPIMERNKLKFTYFVHRRIAPLIGPSDEISYNFTLQQGNRYLRHHTILQSEAVYPLIDSFDEVEN